MNVARRLRGGPVAAGVGKQVIISPARLLSLQSPDGGWAFENLIVGTQTFEHLKARRESVSEG